jgi:hypothetical protein
MAAAAVSAAGGLGCQLASSMSRMCWVSSEHLLNCQSCWHVEHN